MVLSGSRSGPVREEGRGLGFIRHSRQQAYTESAGNGMVKPRASVRCSVPLRSGNTIQQPDLSACVPAIRNNAEYEPERKLLG